MKLHVLLYDTCNKILRESAHCSAKAGIFFKEVEKGKYFMIQKHKKQPLNFLKYIGPGLLVTVGFIDPGNWASNIAAGSGYGYQLLWMVTLSTIMLILLQHNAAHLGIVTGLCLSEAASTYINRILKNIILSTAMLAS